MDENEEGFTLIELLVVIIIIGILAAIAIPVFLNQRKKGWDSAVRSDLRNAATAQETYVGDNPLGVYTSSVPELQSAGFKNSPDANYGTTFAANFLIAGFYSSAATPVYAAGASALGGGYCMTGLSKSGKTFRYDSIQGGLKEAACTGTP